MTGSRRKIFIYEYPSSDLVEEIGVKGLYLDNYFPWNGIANVTIAQRLVFRLIVSQFWGLLLITKTLIIMHGIHDYLKYLKFGFSRATDIACNLIRRDLLTRTDAIELVKQNDGLFPAIIWKVTSRNLGCV